jgi:hypothetical protein
MEGACLNQSESDTFLRVLAAKVLRRQCVPRRTTAIDLFLVAGNLLKYIHKLSRVLAVCAVNSADQIRAVWHDGHEEAGKEEASDLRDCQELLDIAYGRQSGFWIRFDVEQKQAQRQAPLFGPLNFKPGGDSFMLDAFHDDDIRTITENLGYFFPAALDTSRTVKVERLRAPAAQ